MSARAPCPDDCPHCRRNTALMGTVTAARISESERAQLMDAIYDLWLLAHGEPPVDPNHPEAGT